MRAANYAATLEIPDTRAVFFAFDADDAERSGPSGAGTEIPIPLEVVEAPFRDIGDPLTAYLREITADPDSVAVVVMPELVFGGLAARCTTSAPSTSSGCSSSSHASSSPACPTDSTDAVRVRIGLEHPCKSPCSAREVCTWVCSGLGTRLLPQEGVGVSPGANPQPAYIEFSDFRCDEPDLASRSSCAGGPGCSEVG